MLQALVQGLLQGWLVKKLAALPMWLLMGLGAIMLVKWTFHRTAKSATGRIWRRRKGTA